MSFTVSAAQTGSPDVGMAILLKVITGQAASPIGQSAPATSTTPSESITPSASGSWVFGANLGLSGTYTPNGSTTYEQQVSGAGLEYVHMRTTGTTTASTPVTVGGTATVNSISICLLEILAGTGLAEDASSPAGSGYASVETQVTAAFSPPAGSLLVLRVTANGGAGANGIHVTDTSGLGLTWTEQVKQDAAGDGYSGIWTAKIPGTGHTATASLTVTPSFSASRTRGKYRTASLAVTPSLSASRTRGHYRTAALAAAPSLAASRTRGKYRTGSLAVTPSFSASRARGKYRTAALAAVPVLAAAAARGRYRTASLTVVPVFAAHVTGGTAVLFSAPAARQAWTAGPARNM
jgi:hypothetical protein